MKQKTKKVLKVIGMLLILILIGIAVVCIYLFNAEIESRPPKELAQKYQIEEKIFQNRKVFIISPKEKEKTSTVIFYLHGGSYMAETSKTHWQFLEDLVSDTGATIILPDYPLTPKYNYKDVYLMIYPLYQTILEQIDTNNVIVMGDSAGGGIALALCETLGEEGKQQPHKTILISPWLDVTLKNPAILSIESKDKQLNKEALILAGIAYAGEDGMSKYWVNPINGPLEHLQNITIFTGTYDILNPDTHVLEERAKQVNTSIHLKEYEGQRHIWLLERGENKTTQEEEAYQDVIKCILEKDG